MTQEEKIKKIYSYYGLANQSVKTCEEMAELMVELHHALKGEANKEKILEEMCDVELMLRQLREGFKFSKDEFEGGIDYKADRTLERIQNESKTA